MTSDTRPSRMIRAPHLGRIAPGLTSLLKYQRLDLPWDLRAGLSVAAVALPVGVAYAQLAGFNPAVGLYSSIILGQIGKIFGYSITKGGIVPRLTEFIEKLGLTHWPTLAVGLGTFLVLLAAPRLFRGIPAALVAIIVAAIAVRVLGLEGQGVKTVGDVPAGLPHVRVPQVPLALLPSLLGDAGKQSQGNLWN